MNAFKDAMRQETDAARQAYVREINQQAEWLSMVPRTPLTRRQHLTRRCRALQQDAREALARRIAPWLGDE